MQLASRPSPIVVDFCTLWLCILHRHIEVRVDGSHPRKAKPITDPCHQSIRLDLDFSSVVSILEQVSGNMPCVSLCAIYWIGPQNG